MRFCFEMSNALRALTSHSLCAKKVPSLITATVEKSGATNHINIYRENAAFGHAKLPRRTSPVISQWSIRRVRRDRRVKHNWY
jgi:hypothetical protein